MSSSRPARSARGAVLLLALAAACSRGGDAGTDTMAADTAAGAADSGTTGTDHSMHRSAARDTNQAFLRMMVDHHEGLIAMSDSAMGKLSGTAKADAQKIRDKQKTEQDRMRGMLGTQYQDSVTPMMMPSNQPMMDSVTKASSDANTVYYRQVIAHHREGIRMTDRMLPQLSGETKQMATKMREDQQKEIAELERKAGGGK